MNGLIGEFKHKFDTKYRMSLPSKIRNVIGESVIVTKGLDGCAYVYSTAAWQEITDQLGSLSLGNQSARAFSRYILSSATQVDIDASGRILVPENLRVAANLESEVIIAGVGNRLELWSPENWDQQQSLISADINNLVQGLSDIGMI